LSIDLFSGQFFFAAKKTAKSEDVAEYFADVVRQCEQNGWTQVDVFFDRNSTHKAKMRELFAELTVGLTIETRFHFTAAYSPQLNLVEYVIHLIRQKVLHHADCKIDLAIFEERITELCKDPNFLTKEQIINILAHIETLIPDL
jgi:hypothetical protein